MSGRRVLFYVQHLLGIGHVKRAATLARAMSSRGLSVTLVSGGEAVPVLDASGMEFIQLPSVRAPDRSFGPLVDQHGNEVGEEFQDARREKLLSILDQIDPHLVMIELFPFGRRQLRFELMPLIEAARARSPRPVIVSSVRDILVEKNRPERDREMVETARALFDRVLVHGDDQLIPFDRTFPLASEIADLIDYTGYVVEAALVDSAAGEQGAGEVIVSSGSGAVGTTLLQTALDARPLTSMAESTWRLLAGYSLPETDFRELCRRAPEGVIVERARKDFVTLLKNCRLSISQGGYNTIMETLLARARAIAVPYGGGHETEQTLRAGLLAERGLLQQFPEDELTIERLVTAIDRAESLPKPPRRPLNMNGAEVSADIIGRLVT